MKTIDVNLNDTWIVAKLVQKTSHGITRIQVGGGQIGVPTESTQRVFNAAAKRGQRRFYVDPLTTMRKEAETLGQFKGNRTW